MASTNFVPGTLITSTWLNDVNVATYTTVPSNTAAIATKAPIDSPALTGTPTAPTAPLGDSSTLITNMAALNAGLVLKINQLGGTTGSAQIPSGTTAQRPANAVPQIRYNTTLSLFEGYNGASWGTIGGGATGAPGNSVFVENDNTVTGDYTITANKNAMSAGPITINTGVNVTIPTGSVWTIV